MDAEEEEEEDDAVEGEDVEEEDRSQDREAHFVGVSRQRLVNRSEKHEKPVGTWRLNH